MILAYRSMPSGVSAQIYALLLYLFLKLSALIQLILTNAGKQWLVLPGLTPSALAS